VIHRQLAKVSPKEIEPNELGRARFGDNVLKSRTVLGITDGFAGVCCIEVAEDALYASKAVDSPTNGCHWPRSLGRYKIKGLMNIEINGKNGAYKQIFS
jgi:hypothetical protein